MSDDMNQTPASPPARSVLHLLRRGPFARYAAGEATSMTGTWMQTMAQSWVMTTLTHSALLLGLVTFVSSIPMLALTMVGGSMADRYDKRKILIATQVVQIILAVLVGWLVMTGRIQIWHILVASFLLGISASFEMPSSSALVPELVTKENIAGAIAIDRSIFHGTRLIGPALAGLCIGAWGMASAFYLNAVSFLALIAALASIGPRSKGTEAEEEQRTSGMKAGWNYVRGDKPTLAMLALMATAALCIFPILAVMMPLYGRLELGLNAAFTGFLMATSGLGSLIGAVGLVSVPRPRRVLWMVAASADVALALCGLALARAFWQAALALTALAAGTSMNFGLANTTVQERAPGPLRGRVSALAGLSFFGVMPFASVGMPALADLVGIRWVMALGGLIYGCSAYCIFSGPGRFSTELPAERVVAVPVEA